MSIERILMKTITLTPEQLQVLAQNGPEPVEALDAAGNAAYVLLRREEYERLQAQREGAEEQDWAEGALPLVMEVFARDGWDDPAMDVYDEAEMDHRQSSLLVNEAMKEDDKNDPLLESYQHRRSEQS
jgi:hypothetical protein